MNWPPKLRKNWTRERTRTDSVATNQKQQFQWDFVVLQRNQQNTTERLAIPKCSGSHPLIRRESYPPANQIVPC